MATPTAITSSPVRGTGSPVINGRSPSLQSFLQSGQLSGDLKNLVSLLGSQSAGSSSITLEQLLSPSRQGTPTNHTPITPQSGDSWSTGRKRFRNTSDTPMHLKRRRVSAKQSVDKQQGKGLRHFSQRVCEKVREKGNTTYNEVADELVRELSEAEAANGNSDMSIDQKNIRRRVYDALNVLMAMNIISKEKKEIQWIGLPTNSAQECQHVEEELAKVEQRVADKRSEVESLLIQILSFKNLMKRNRERVASLGMPTSNSSISLPFILASTNKKTTIDCSISSDKSEYVFSFDSAFELHNDIEVLKKMGLDCSLHSGIMTEEDVMRAKAMLPKAFESALDDLVSSRRAAAAASSSPKVTADPVTPSTSQSITNSPLLMAINQTLLSSDSKPSSPVIVPSIPVSGIPSPQAVTALVTSVMRGAKIPASKSPGSNARALLHSHCPSSQAVPISPLIKSSANIPESVAQMQATEIKAVNVVKLPSPQHITSLLQQLQQGTSLSKLISTAANSSASRQLFTSSTPNITNSAPNITQASKQ